MFENQNSIVLSETGARRMFRRRGSDRRNHHGQTQLRHQWQEIDVTVTGVYRDFPSNSHFKPKYILNINAFRSVDPNFDNYLEGSRFQDSSTSLRTMLW